MPITPGEYLDIVDENGNLTGEKEIRSIVHDKGLWHRTVHIYFYRIKDNTINILAHLRSKLKDHDPDKWDTRLGGHVNTGKDIGEAIVSEIQEEVGISINPKYLLKGEIKKYDGGKNREFCHVFYYNFLENDNVLKFNDGEVQAVKWMSDSEIADSMQKNPSFWAPRRAGFIETIENLKTKL